MPNGFLATGGVSQLAGFGFLDIGDTVDVNPDGQRTSRKWFWFDLRPADLTCILVWESLDYHLLVRMKEVLKFPEGVRELFFTKEIRSAA